MNWEFTRAEAGQLGELVHVERLVRGGIGDRDADQVVGKAEHPPALDDLLELGEGRLEALDGRAVLEREIDVHDDLEAAPDALGVDVGVVAADRARGLERADAAQARGGRQAHALGELDVAEAPVGLQLAQNRAIERIHWQIMPYHCHLGRKTQAYAQQFGIALPGMDPARRTILRDAAGVGLAVGVYGVSFGVLAVAAGASVAQAMALSLLVFTGASQFAFVGVIAGGGSAAAAVAPALMLAARNGIYGLSLAPVLTGTRVARLLQSHLVIDESTAMARAEDSPAHARTAFLFTGLAVLLCWNAGTLAGALTGGGIGDPRDLGMDAMFPAAFLALLSPQLRRPGAPRAAVTGALIAAALITITPPGIPIVAAIGALVPAGARRPAHASRARGVVSWAAILVLAAASYGLKAFGTVLVGDREIRAPARALLDLAPVPLLAALILTQTVSSAGALVIDARLPALGVAGAPHLASARRSS